jgi:hypothetical protein
MPEIRQAAVGYRNPAQAIELSLLVDLEACWENLRKTPQGDTLMQNLKNRQKAYDVFRSKLVVYNKRFTPAHVPELLLNTPSRLGKWCQRMRDLYLQVEHDPQGHCPLHLLEKAYQCADRVGVRLNKDRVSRSTPPGTIRDAIRELEALGQWCDRLAPVAATA